MFTKAGGITAAIPCWWGMDVGGLGLAYLSGALVLGLGLLGLWRQLCTRLDVRTPPWAWPLGLALGRAFFCRFAEYGHCRFFQQHALLALAGTAYVALQHMDQHLRAWAPAGLPGRQRWREALEALPPGSAACCWPL